MWIFSSKGNDDYGLDGRDVVPWYMAGLINGTFAEHLSARSGGAQSGGI